MSKRLKIPKDTEQDTEQDTERPRQLGKILLELRTEKGWPLKEAAYAIWRDVRRSNNLSQYEHGAKGFPTLTTRSRMENGYGLDPGELMKRLETYETRENEDLPHRIFELFISQFLDANPDATEESFYLHAAKKEKEYRSYAEMRKANAHSPDRPDFQPQIDAARAAFDVGDFEHADSMFAKAEEIQITRTLREVGNQAAIRMERGRGALFCGQTEHANLCFLRAAEALDAVDSTRAAEIRLEAIKLLHRHYRDYGGETLGFAISFAEKGLSSAPKDSLIAALLQTELGNVLTSEGYRRQRKAQQECYARAVEAHQIALAWLKPKTFPEDRARAQHNLATTHWRQGYQSSGGERQRYLSASCELYKGALRVWERDDASDRWAATQSGLGNVYSTLTENADATEASKISKHAVLAYRNALTVRTRINDPVGWAGIQNNLGLCIAEACQREGDDAPQEKIVEAIGAFEHAMEIFSKEAAPRQWARLQNNLGTASSEKARRCTGTEAGRLFRSSYKAFDAALKVRTKTTNPSQWMMTKLCYANALRKQGEVMGKKRGRKALESARSHLTEALKGVSSRKKGSHYLEECRIALKSIEEQLTS